MQKTAEFYFFWSGPLSQWHLCTFYDDGGVVYNCAEQYMMANKALLFGDIDTFRKIMATDSPKIQKSLGRSVSPFDENVWLKNARAIVYEGNRLKFTQNPELKSLLMSTTGRLVEASPYDKIWGIGMDEDNPDVIDPSKWKGTNWLGEVLTELRTDLSKLAV